jgi:subtilase family protein
MAAEASNVQPTPLTARMLRQGRIAYSGTDKTPLALAVKDQLIVQIGPNGSIVQGVQSYLDSKKIGTQRLGETVFSGLPGVSPENDFVVLELHGAADIFHQADELRANVLKENPGAVSPNHILVPAPNLAGCPYGPPSEAPDVSLAPPEGPSPVVTVIDSGYQWDPAHWGANPLDDPGFSSISINYAERLQGTATLAAVAPGSTAGWLAGAPEAPALNGTAANPKLLFALAGHANFVAGVIAQGCHQPTIHIWSHNSTYVRNTDYFTTEAAVVRSLALSQSPMGTGPTDVIHVGFAFPLRAAKFSFRFARDFLSLAWTTAFQILQATFDAAGKAPPIVIAPAGNEKEPFRHYPAALALEFAKTPFASLFENVKGVGSISAAPLAANPRSTFSNYGNWVTCSAVGENVQSTFLRVTNVVCEDDESPRPVKSFADAWATWNGTSFAAPKVAAAVAAYVAAGAGSATPAQAWQSLTQVHGHPLAHPASGILFTNL